MNAGVFEERGGRGRGEELRVGLVGGPFLEACGKGMYFDVDVGDVSYDVVLIVNDSE